MLPASDLSEILINLAALNLQPNTAAQILAAVLAPLLRRSSERDAPAIAPEQRLRSPGRRRSKPRRSLLQKRKYRRRHLGPSEPRARAIEALKAKPDATNAEIGKKLQISPSTVFNARKQLGKEARKEARKAVREAARETSTTAKLREPRERAQRFLREQLARGTKPASFVEDAAEKAHIDARALEQARTDLGILVSRSNAGGVQAVQWSLPAG
jgi:Mn-dependent DtxR family transcriptional regulator